MTKKKKPTIGDPPNKFEQLLPAKRPRTPPLPKSNAATDNKPSSIRWRKLECKFCVLHGFRNYFKYRRGLREHIRGWHWPSNWR